MHFSATVMTTTATIATVTTTPTTSQGKEGPHVDPYVEKSTCELHIRTATPHVVSVYDHIRTVYDHRAKSYVDSICGNHMRSPYTEIIYGKPNVVYRI